LKNKKIAIVHDWLLVKGGAEVVLKHLLELFPKADVFTLIDALPSSQRGFLQGHKIYTSALNRYTFFAKKYKYFMPFMPYFIEQFDLSKYDVVISSSHFVAKGVITHPHQLHVSYIHSPIRYAWDSYYEYNKIGALGSGLRKFIMKLWLHKLRIWDCISALRVDYLVANSHFISQRIQKTWRRDSEVIYPPVELEGTIFCEKKEEYYVTMSRLVEYKRTDIIVQAFNKMPNKKLIIIGEGRCKKALEKQASSNIEFRGYLSKKEAMQIISKAKGFVFMPKEDFGITPIEAQACGTPVIAYGMGGALETVKEGESGVFVMSQDCDELKKSIENFESMEFNPFTCKEIASQFSPEKFKEKFLAFIEKKKGKQ
jgi:glycosyltransferase involved in cell wall biosynthesis